MGATHFSGPLVVTNQVAQGTGSVEIVAAAKTLVAADNGKVFVMDAAAGATITLPALVNGLRFRFVVGATFATTNWIIDSAEGDNINGILVVNGASVAAVGEDQINFVATAEAIGDWIELIADSNNSQWLVTGVGAGAGSITATDPS